MVTEWSFSAKFSLKYNLKIKFVFFSKSSKFQFQNKKLYMCELFKFKSLKCSSLDILIALENVAYLLKNADIIQLIF